MPTIYDDEKLMHDFIYSLDMDNNLSISENFTVLENQIGLFGSSNSTTNINKILDSFSKRLYTFESIKNYCKSQDSTLILLYSINILCDHFKLLNCNCQLKKEDFINVNKNCNDGENFDEEFLENIYYSFYKNNNKSYFQKFMSYLTSLF